MGKLKDTFKRLKVTDVKEGVLLACPPNQLPPIGTPSMYRILFLSFSSSPTRLGARI